MSNAVPWSGDTLRKSSPRVTLIPFFPSNDLEFLWKAFFLLIFLFYVIQFHEEIFAAYYRFKYNYAKEVVNWIYGIGKATYYFLFISWAITLIRIYYSASGFLSELTIRIQVIITLLYWVLFNFLNTRCFDLKILEINHIP